MAARHLLPFAVAAALALPSAGHAAKVTNAQEARAFTAGYTKALKADGATRLKSGACRKQIKRQAWRYARKAYFAPESARGYYRTPKQYLGWIRYAGQLSSVNARVAKACGVPRG